MSSTLQDDQQQKIIAAILPIYIQQFDGIIDIELLIRRIILSAY